jgi:hypothetical protein
MAEMAREGRSPAMKPGRESHHAGHTWPTIQVDDPRVRAVARDKARHPARNDSPQGYKRKRPIAACSRSLDREPQVIER